MSDFAAAFESSERFEEASEGFAVTANDWDAVAVPDGGSVVVSVTVPTLDAVVEGEVVAPVVEDGWFETFALRVADVTGVTNADVTEPSVSCENGEIRVETTVGPREGQAADDVLAVVNYVEGTWFEGVIPGYDYVEKVQGMRERASQSASDATGKQGTPL